MLAVPQQNRSHCHTPAKSPLQNSGTLPISRPQAACNLRIETARRFVEQRLQFRFGG